MGYGWISFTTDYGLTDGFVAACHGTIARIAPQVRVIDVGHQVPPGDIRRGALLLAQVVPYLPPAVHLAVVDPGVGTARHPIAVRTPRGLLVGPDNGLLPWAADALGGSTRVVLLDNADLFLTPVRRTFHGRDIFAPVAARLAAGLDLADAGSPLDPADLARLPEPVARSGDGWLEAEVLAVDRFGNLQLAAGAAALHRIPRRLEVAGTPAERGETFGSVASGALVVYADSADQVAVAVNGGSAAHHLRVTPGDILRIAAAPAAGRTQTATRGRTQTAGLAATSDAEHDARG
ncbi:MAG: SAM hydrolase/SAM-dependent halogenase family protein [Micromonosporaceae bacterium]